MKILLLTREFPPQVTGGVAYHSYNLARELTDLGHDVTVISSESGQNSKDNSDFNLDNIEVKILQHRNVISSRLWFNRAIGERISEIVNLDDFDTIHSHEFVDFNKIEFEGKKILKIHINLTENPKYMEAKDFSKPIKPLAKFLGNRVLSKIQKRLEKKALETSDSRIYNSKLTKKIYEERYKFEDPNYRVIYNGTDPKKFDLKSSKENYLLFVGGKSKRKGFRKLSRVIKKEEDPIPKIKIAGTLQRNQISKELTENDKVELIGRVNQDKLIELYQNASALIHPALYEPFGNVILESLSCGTPVIISNEKHCGAAEILGENISKQIEPEEKSLKKAIKEAEDWGVEAEECREVAEKYTWKRVAEETIDFVD
jgi:glycosyltransferase involved in cell wall biosynthesis